MTTITPLALEGCLLIQPRRFADPRGTFSEVFREEWFADTAPPVRFVQDNHSSSRLRGTVRGLHFQRPPRAQAKLIRVTRGAILDVAVDMRDGSSTYGQHLSFQLSAENGHQIYVPAGFLHGFCTLEDDTEVTYKVSDTYSASHDGSVRWNDPTLGIQWPVDGNAILSDKDRIAPLLSDLGDLFPETRRG
jgi:dTDP-4-dehydrorhamnose 3,5-epimerase